MIDTKLPAGMNLTPLKAQQELFSTYRKQMRTEKKETELHPTHHIGDVKPLNPSIVRALP